MGALVLIALVLVVCYRISLAIHPEWSCRTCKGTGRHRGVVWTSATRPCGRCHGSGRVPRLGVRLLNRQK